MAFLREVKVRQKTRFESGMWRPRSMSPIVTSAAFICQIRRQLEVLRDVEEEGYSYDTL